MQERMDLSFMEIGRAPLLWMHDAEQVLGVVDRVELGADRKSRAVVRLGKTTDLQRQTADKYLMESSAMFQLVTQSTDWRKPKKKLTAFQFSASKHFLRRSAWSPYQRTSQWESDVT